MHQNQWLKALQVLGDTDDPFDHLPIPDTFPMEETPDEFDYSFLTTTREKRDYEAPWTQGESVDGKGQFSTLHELDIEGAVRHVNKANPKTHNEVKGKTGSSGAGEME